MADERRSDWSVLALLRWTTTYLTDKGLPDPRLSAEYLLAGTLGVKRLDLYLQFDRPLHSVELAEFRGRLRRRARREPLQYIEGRAAFRDLCLQVDRRVLIPRPETELLAEEVLAWAAGKQNLAAVDIGTGSGALALSLATEGPFVRVVATDVSAAALEVARENFRAVAPPVPVEFREGAGYTPLGGEAFDVIISNPPYIGLGERPTLAPEVRDWEPADALFAGETGYEIFRDLVGGALAHLRAGGLLALEVGHRQAEAVAEMIETTGGFGPPCPRRDYAGRERIVLADKRPVGDDRGGTGRAVSA